MDSRILSTIEAVFGQVRIISSSVASIYRNTRGIGDRIVKILHNQDKILEYVELQMMRERDNCAYYGDITDKRDIVMFKEGCGDVRDRLRLFKVLTWLKQEDESVLVMIEPMSGDSSDRHSIRYNIENFHKINI